MQWSSANVVVVLIALSCVSVEAQNPPQRLVPVPGGQAANPGEGPAHQVRTDQLLAGAGGYYYDGYYNDRRAVTAEQGRLLGTAEVLRSAGEFNKHTAGANVLQEEARRRAIDNRYNAVQTYFEVRQLNERYRAVERGPQPVLEDMLRYTRAALPERLPATALNRDTGVIYWPALLRRPEFAEHRARLEQIFQGRGHSDSGVASVSYLEIQEEAARMLATLQNHVRKTDPTAYIHGKKFVTSLGFEGRFAAGDDRVAQRQ